MLDHGTAVNLELLRSNSIGNQPDVSLYTILNKTNTLTGALTLRSNLLEPPTGKCMQRIEINGCVEKPSEGCLVNML